MDFMSFLSPILDDPGNHTGMSLTGYGAIAIDHECNDVEVIPIASCETLTFRVTGELNQVVTCGKCGRTWAVTYLPDAYIHTPVEFTPGEIAGAWEEVLYVKRN